VSEFSVLQEGGGRRWTARRHARRRRRRRRLVAVVTLLIAGHDTTALALAKLGPDYKFHTTLETRGTISPAGTLSGDVVLVGRGDPNLSNRRFPYELKEEFDGPPEKVLIELADSLAVRGVKEISVDVIGDDSYFPRVRYPNGWEIDDMVWEYGAAISAIVVDDNTVALTLTPSEKAGDPVMASAAPLTPDFTLENDVTTSAAEVK